MNHAGLPSEWRGTALVALHGSWNRTRRAATRSSHPLAVRWRDRERDSSGFEEARGDRAPVDVAEGFDGTIYISDDYASAVYWVKSSRTQSSDAGADVMNGVASTTWSDFSPIITR